MATTTLDRETSATTKSTPADVQVLIPTTAAEVEGPVPGNKMIEAYVQLVL